MDTDALDKLDYYRIRDEIAGCCCSEEGRAALLAREPLSDPLAITGLKNEGREWAVYIRSGRQVALSCWDPVAPLLAALRTEGAFLSPEELASIGRFCKAAENCRAGLGSAFRSGLDIRLIAEKSARMPSAEPVRQEISRIIDEQDGCLRDIPELRAIRDNIRRIRGEIDAVMRRYASDPSLNGVLQSNIPALRAGRPVLAVRSGQRGQIKGIIHELSQTGQTVYIEPEEAVRRNNELVEAEFLLEQETRRILKELTARISPYRTDLQGALDTMICFDMAFAAARWGERRGGVFADGCGQADDSGMEVLLPPVLKKARHPLFGDAAVPIDMEFTDGCRVLIITGPNTGGKTAAIKTFALFAALNQSGFPVPAAEGTRFPVFSKLFADIGDPQSLDESLSTFSGRMKNISQALAGADERSLVLLDELGSGTDPQEGSAIAMAVLDELIGRGCFVLVTTHHGLLKNYGYTHKSCQNASVEFDTDTLAPVYRIAMGVPGESRALDIALRSGLPQAVVEKARSCMAGGSADISALISGLSKKHTELDQLLKETKEKEREAASRSAAALEKELLYRQKELKMREEGNTAARRFLEESRRKLENLVRELREGEITRDKTKAVKQFIQDLAEQEQSDSGAIVSAREQLLHDQKAAAAQKNSAAAQLAHKQVGAKKKRIKNAEAFALAKGAGYGADGIPADLMDGMEVTVCGGGYGSGAKGIIERKGKDGNCIVRFGSMRMSVPAEKLAPLRNPSRYVKPDVSVDLSLSGNPDIKSGSSVSGCADAPVFELRLIGMRCEQAIKALERQLDLAGMYGLRSFSVIHGKGEGVLQAAVHEYLKSYAGVTEFHFAGPEDGGTGKTYVTLG